MILEEIRKKALKEAQEKDWKETQKKILKKELGVPVKSSPQPSEIFANPEQKSRKRLFEVETVEEKPLAKKSALGLQSGKEQDKLPSSIPQFGQGFVQNEEFLKVR